MNENPTDGDDESEPVLGSERKSLNSNDYERLVTRLDIEVVPVENERILEVVDELDAIADNGGALIRKLEIIDDDGVFEYVREMPSSSIHNMLWLAGFHHDVLRSPELNAAIEGLDTEAGFSGWHHWNEIRTGGGASVNPRDPVHKRFELGWFYPHLVDGTIALRLVHGGAYSSFDGTDAEAKALGRQFEQEIIGDRYEVFHAWRLENIQWSRWFSGMPFLDDTIILVDEDEKLLWVFMFSSCD